ncbi:TetR family transcriptional regulator [Kribbella antibiotica]|uniref:TetR family transcriptional regulator n=1 Tax=Kribbella antibiotica TaxID=190195 RepID=A0A4R4ZV10_9ACTN|nr:TetR family transcriptional regulator [Kribbella antibiotica]TDD63008.1 TetR family transcriptional regulator [Kribbella antibiotica]
MKQAEGGLRERKKLQTRAALTEAALRLALEKGPDNVTVDEIAEAADVSVRTFFNYFPHKEHAILGRNPAHLERALELIRTAPDEQSPLTTMWMIVHDVLQELLSEGSLTRRGELIMTSPSLLFHLMLSSMDDERQLSEALTERIGDPLRAKLIVTSAGTACRVAVELHKTTPDSAPGDLVDAAFQLLAQGIDPDYQKGQV